MSETLTFKTSDAALAERRNLLRDLRTGLALAVVLLCAALGNAPFGIQLIAWALGALIIWGLWKQDGEGMIGIFSGRELRIQDNALEIVQGRFTRLLFFEQLEQLRMIQGRDERVLALELQTLDGAVLLRGYENMEALFGALSARKPARVILEVEESRFDKTSVAFWHKAALWSGVILLTPFFLLRPSDQTLKELSGLLLISLGAFFAYFQPFSHRRGKKAALVEVGIGAVFILFGILFLI